MLDNVMSWKVVTCSWIVMASFGMSASFEFVERNIPSDSFSNIREQTPSLPDRPHVILIVADDLGWNDVPWNNPEVFTPNLGKLANNGVILNQSYVLPTCAPTRAALLTGRYPHTIGMQHGVLKPLELNGLSTRYKLLPQPLRKYGYSTHMIGKWHLGFCSWDYTPTRRGFDTFYGFYTGAQNYFTHKRVEEYYSKVKTKGGRLRKKKPQRKKRYLDLRNNTKIDTTKEDIYSTDLFASAAEEIIESRDPEKPMFLYLPFQSVHAPLQVPENYADALYFVKNKKRRNYLGMVLAMDDAVGRVVNALKKTGHYNNSVIIFTTDNGGFPEIGGSNYPLRGSKSVLLEGGTRGPAFVHSPLLPNPGTVSNQLFHVTDWYSTIVALAGGKSPNRLDSINQWNAIAGYANPPRTKMVYNVDDSTGDFKAALRWNDMKLSVGQVQIKGTVPFYLLESKIKDFSSLNIEEDNSEESDTKFYFSEDKSFDYYDEGSFTFHKYSDFDDSLTGKGNKRPKNSHKKKKKNGLQFKEKLMGHKKNSAKALRKASNKALKWKRFEKRKTLTWDKDVLRILNTFLKRSTKIRLYNITADPTESNNIVKDNLELAQDMMYQLSTELQRYEPMGPRIMTDRGHPEKWGNVWSPGWCTAE